PGVLSLGRGIIHCSSSNCGFVPDQVRRVFGKTQYGDLKGLLFSVTQDLLSIIFWMNVAKGYLCKTSSFLKFIIGALFSDRRYSNRVGYDPSSKYDMIFLNKRDMIWNNFSSWRTQIVPNSTCLSIFSAYCGIRQEMWLEQG
ncbi:hypothetical protein MG293_012731, partial [Ovis ammon polii]